MATTSRPLLNRRLEGFGTTIFAEMSALATRTGAINLGQGFPDTDGPTAVIEAAIEAMRAGQNQYPPGPGIAPLRQAIAAHQQRFYGIALDPDGDVLVTTGAQSQLFLLTTSAICKALSVLHTSTGAAAFPDVTYDGGSIGGIPLVVSDGVPAATLLLVDAAQVAAASVDAG